MSADTERGRGFLEEGRGVKRGFSDNPFKSLEGVKCGQSEHGSWA